uniref:Uncharacterized protein n=1 Tax=Ditylenchus dipsaci TaxID=166011 RepID=A0A915EAW7_9BILA
MEYIADYQSSGSGSEAENVVTPKKYKSYSAEFKLKPRSLGWIASELRNGEERNNCYIRLKIRRRPENSRNDFKVEAADHVQRPRRPACYLGQEATSGKKTYLSFDSAATSGQDFQYREGRRGVQGEQRYSAIYAADETAVFLDQPGGKSKRSSVLTTGHDKARITVMLTARSVGKKLKPFVLLPRKRMDKEAKAVVEKYKSKLELSWKGTVWMYDDLTSDYLDKISDALSLWPIPEGQFELAMARSSIRKIVAMTEEPDRDQNEENGYLSDESLVFENNDFDITQNSMLLIDCVL